jgi:hypothetical protein
MKKFDTFVAALALGIAFTGSNASAAELVKNGGFETGDLTGWQRSGNPVAVNGDTPRSGAYSAMIVDNTAGSLSQRLPTIAGQQYNLTFSFFTPTIDAHYTDQFKVFWEGVEIYNGENDIVNQDWYKRELKVLATGPNSKLEFTSGDNDYTRTFVDDISVQGLAAAVPEPAGWLMMIVGFGFIGFGMRRNKARTRISFATMAA